jgi:hypothetical protein
VPDDTLAFQSKTQYGVIRIVRVVFDPLDIQGRTLQVLKGVEELGGRFRFIVFDLYDLLL